ncbi:MAG: hypothetical protein SVC26_00175 [Pseudomonadota bacterium]|nr:hypothetical protein [Pseudomonadota bacterium]
MKYRQFGMVAALSGLVFWTPVSAKDVAAKTVETVETAVTKVTEATEVAQEAQDAAQQNVEAATKEVQAAAEMGEAEVQSATVTATVTETVTEVAPVVTYEPVEDPAEAKEINTALKAKQSELQSRAQSISKQADLNERRIQALQSQLEKLQP